MRYFVTQHEPGRWVDFQFTSPAGFKGSHTFTAISRAENSTLLRHERSMSPSGTALLTWLRFFCPLHDALIEESLDRVENESGSSPGLVRRRALCAKIFRSPFSALMANKRNAR